VPKEHSDQGMCVPKSRRRSLSRLAASWSQSDAVKRDRADVERSGERLVQLCSSPKYLSADELAVFEPGTCL